MTLLKEVCAFADEFIHDKKLRTAARKRKIRVLFERLTGESIAISCNTCYVKALYKILNITNMASSKYELKRGVVLQAFGDASKTCTNDTITDELGDWYMKHYPEKSIYFARLPVQSQHAAPPEIRIIQPAAVQTIKPEAAAAPAPKALIDAVVNAPQQQQQQKKTSRPTRKR